MLDTQNAASVGDSIAIRGIRQRSVLSSSSCKLIYRHISLIASISMSAFHFLHQNRGRTESTRMEAKNSSSKRRQIQKLSIKVCLIEFDTQSLKTGHHLQ